MGASVQLHLKYLTRRLPSPKEKLRITQQALFFSSSQTYVRATPNPRGWLSKKPTHRPQNHAGHEPPTGTHAKASQPAMELLLLPCRAASARPLLPASHGAFRRAAGATAARPAAASSSNVEVIDATATTTSSTGAEKQWRAGGLGLELDLSEEMRRGMMWRMLAPPAVAVAADAAFLGLLERAQPGDVPAWAATAGSAVLFAVGLLGVHYGFLSSRWDAAETGSVVGWDLAVRHWNVLSMAKDSSSSVDEEEEDYDEEYEDDVEYEEDED